MTLTIPSLSLVVLIGPSGAGKSTFAARHFRPTEVISSDFCRGLVADDQNDQSATRDAFDVLHFIAGKRLAAGRLTVVDATSVRPEDRKPLIALAREYHCLPVAVVFNLPPAVCLARNESRPDRNFGAHVVRQQTQLMRRSINNLAKRASATSSCCIRKKRSRRQSSSGCPYTTTGEASTGPSTSSATSTAAATSLRPC